MSVSDFVKFKFIELLTQLKRVYPELPDEHSNHPDDHTINPDNHIDPTYPCRTVQKYRRLNRAKCL